MRYLPRLPLLLVSGLALTTLWGVSSAPLGPAPLEPALLEPALLEPALLEPELMTSIVESHTGGFVLYQPFNDVDGQIPGEPFTKNGKQYSVTTERWTAVGFLRVEEGEEEGELVEYWYLSEMDTASTVTGSPVSFVEKYYWPGRSSPTGDKHLDWNDLPVRFWRRNDLSGTADLEEFIAEVGTVYGFSLAASAGKFERYDHKASKAAGY